MNDSFISFSCAKEIAHILIPFISSNRPHPHVTHVIRLTVTPGRSYPQTELYSRSFISPGRPSLQAVHIFRSFISSTTGKLLRVNVHASYKVDARTQKVAHHNVSHVRRCGDARMANILHGAQVKVSGNGARGSHGK